MNLARQLSFLNPLYRFVFPPVCFVCDGLLQENERRVCGSCWSSIKTISDEDSLYLEMSSRLTSSGHIAGLISAYHFEKDGVIQSLIHQLKYEGMTTLGVELGKRLGECIVQSPPISIDAVLPVPLHPLKVRERGYNQSEYVCKGIQMVTGFQVTPLLLKRRKYTQSQTQLNSEERKLNVGDAFEVNPSYKEFVSHRTFLIVDDVITTGATIEACAHVLVSNDASRVVACSVALAE